MIWLTKASELTKVFFLIKGLSAAESVEFLSDPPNVDHWPLGGGLHSKELWLQLTRQKPRINQTLKSQIWGRFRQELHWYRLLSPVAEHSPAGLFSRFVLISSHKSRKQTVPDPSLIWFTISPKPINCNFMYLVYRTCYFLFRQQFLRYRLRVQCYILHEFHSWR